MTHDILIEAYTITSASYVSNPVFIIILLVRDLGKYSKLSDKIDSILKDLSEDLGDKGFKKNSK